MRYEKRAPAESFRVAGAEIGRISSRKAFRRILQQQQQQSLLISLQRVTHESTKSRNICKIHNFAVLHFQFLKFKIYCQ